MTMDLETSTYLQFSTVSRWVMTSGSAQIMEVSLGGKCKYWHNTIYPGGRGSRSHIRLTRPALGQRSLEFSRKGDFSYFKRFEKNIGNMRQNISKNESLITSISNFRPSGYSGRFNVRFVYIRTFRSWNG